MSSTGAASNIMKRRLLAAADGSSEFGVIGFKRASGQPAIQNRISESQRRLANSLAKLPASKARIGTSSPAASDTRVRLVFLLMRVTTSAAHAWRDRIFGNV